MLSSRKNLPGLAASKGWGVAETQPEPSSQEGWKGQCGQGLLMGLRRPSTIEICPPQHPSLSLIYSNIHLFMYSFKKHLLGTRDTDTSIFTPGVGADSGKGSWRRRHPKSS